MKKSFKDRLSALGLSYTKEMLILLAVNAVIIGIMLTMYLLLKEISSFVIGGLLLAIANFFYLSRYSTLEKDKETRS